MTLPTIDTRDVHDPDGQAQQSSPVEEAGQWTAHDWAELLESPRKLDRLEAARHLADSGDRSTSGALAKALAREKKAAVRVELGVALGLMGDDRALPGLLSAVERGRPNDLTAIALLGCLGGAPPALPLGEWDPHARRIIAAALLRAYRRFMVHPLVKVRILASLVQNGEERSWATGELLKSTFSRKEEVRGYAVQLLGEAGGAAYPDVRERLEQVAGEQSEPARLDALAVLFRHDPERYGPTFRKIAQDGGWRAHELEMAGLPVPDGLDGGRTPTNEG